MAAKSFLYRKKIVNSLYFSRQLSCAELSEKIEKSLSLTTKIVNELVQEEVVLETGYAPSSGGRRPLMYTLRADIMYVIAVAMDQYATRIALLDMHNQVLHKREIADLNIAVVPDALQVVCTNTLGMLEEAGVEKHKVLGVGVGMPGFIDAKNGRNHSFTNLCEGSITSYMEKEIGIPVYIDNDSSLIALAELRFGAARDKRNVMVVNIGWGIGLGMILDEMIFRGDDGFAGELSHIPLFQNGKLCSCGKSGCLETEASLSAVIEKARLALLQGKPSTLTLVQFDRESPQNMAQLIMQAAGKGDRFAVELLSEAGYNIGRGIAILIHLLNPGCVVLSGKGAQAGKILQAPIQQALNEHCIPSLAANTQVIVSQLGKDAQLIGGAALVMERYERTIINKRKTTEVA